MEQRPLGSRHVSSSSFSFSNSNSHFYSSASSPLAPTGSLGSMVHQRFHLPRSPERVVVEIPPLSSPVRRRFACVDEKRRLSGRRGFVSSSQGSGWSRTVEISIPQPAPELRARVKQYLAQSHSSEATIAPPPVISLSAYCKKVRHVPEKWSDNVPVCIPLCSLNCRSIRSNSRFLPLVTLLGLLHQQGVALLCETRISSDELVALVARITPHLFVAASSIDERRPNGSGVAVLAPLAWRGAMTNSVSLPGYASMAQFRFRTEVVKFAAVYVPCRGTAGQQNSYRPQLLSFLVPHLSGGGSVFIGGDFNDIAHLQDASPAHWLAAHIQTGLPRQLLDLGMIDVGAHHRVVGPTLVSKHCNARLDYVFMSTEGIPFSSQVEIIPPTVLTDHAGIRVALNTSAWHDVALAERRRKARQVSSQFAVDYRKATVEEFAAYRADIEDHLARAAGRAAKEGNYCSRSANQLWEQYSSVLLRSAARHLPLRKVGGVRRSQTNCGAMAEVVQQLREAVISRVYKVSPAVRKTLGESKLVLQQTPASYRTNLSEAMIMLQRAHTAEISVAAAALRARHDSELSTPRAGIQHLLKQYRAREDLCFASAAEEGDPPLLDPPAVRQALAAQVDMLFARGKDFSEDQVPEKWKHYFAPIPESVAALSQVWGPPTRADIRAAISATAPLKAPGRSGITGRMLRQTGVRAAKLLKKLFQSITASESIPDLWRESTLLFLAKTPAGFTGTIAKMRPIVLQETPMKVYLKIFIARISRILAEKDLLKGSGGSVLPGSTVSTSLHPLTAAISESRTTGRDLLILLEDKSAAFDSISFSLLECALRRVGVPAPFIRLYVESILPRRRLFLDSAFGTCNSVVPARGVPQGGVESPLFFIICYDIGLCIIRDETKPFAACVPPDLEPLVAIEQPLLQVNLSAFVDDLAVLTGSLKDMVTAVAALDEFNILAGLRPNTEKTKLVCMGDSFVMAKAVPVSIKYAGQELVAVHPRTAVRLLGVFFSARDGLRPSMLRAQQNAKQLCSLVARHVISPARLQMMLRTVIMPSVAYPLRYVPPDATTVASINRIITGTARRMYRLSSQLPSFLFTSALSMKLPLLESWILRDTLGELMIALRSEGRVADAVRATLSRLQQCVWASRCLLQSPVVLAPGYRHHLAPLITIMAAWGVSVRLHHPCGKPIPPRPKEVGLTVPVPGALAADRRVLAGACVLQPSDLRRLELLLRTALWAVRAVPRKLEEVAAAYGYIGVNGTTRHLFSRDVVKISGRYFLIKATEWVSARQISLLMHLECVGDEFVLCNDTSCPLRSLLPSSSKCAARMITAVLPLVCCRLLASPFRPTKALKAQGPEWESITDSCTQLGRQVVKWVPPGGPVGFENRAALTVSRVQGLFPNVEILWLPGPVAEAGLSAIWSDGSVVLAKSFQVSVSAAAYMVAPAPLLFCCRAPLGPASSYRAELWGAILALAAGTGNDTLLLVTDSKSMVAALPRLLKHLTPRAALRVSYPDEWAVIRFLVSSRNVKVRIKWVRGHSADEFNKVADLAANLAHGLERSYLVAGALPPHQMMYIHNTVINQDFAPVVARLPHTVADSIALRWVSWRVGYKVDAQTLLMHLQPPRNVMTLPLYRFVLRMITDFLPTPGVLQRLNEGAVAPCCVCALDGSSLWHPFECAPIVYELPVQVSPSLLQIYQHLSLGGVPDHAMAAGLVPAFLTRQGRELLPESRRKKAARLSQVCQSVAITLMARWRLYCARAHLPGMPSGLEALRRPRPRPKPVRTHRCRWCGGWEPTCCATVVSRSGVLQRVAMGTVQSLLGYRAASVVALSSVLL